MSLMFQVLAPALFTNGGWMMTMGTSWKICSDPFREFAYKKKRCGWHRDCLLIAVSGHVCRQWNRYGNNGPQGQGEGKTDFELNCAALNAKKFHGLILSAGQRMSPYNFLEIRAAQLSSKSVRSSKWDGMGWLQLYGRLMYVSNESEAKKQFS